MRPPGRIITVSSHQSVVTEMEAHQLPTHVFLSYSSEDEAAVATIRAALQQADIPFWIDTQDLIPGTPDWEHAIRFAIQSSTCIVLLCSPHARKSPFVRAELSLSQHFDISILPVWIGGDSWIDSVPMSLSQTQHLDLRGKDQEQVRSSLCVRLKAIVQKSKPKHAVIDDCYAGWYDHSLRYHAHGFNGFISILLDERPSSRTPPEKRRKEQMAVFDPEAYPSTQCVLDDLFMNYLSERTEPLTYGKEWLLSGKARKGRGINPERIVAPWSYLEFLWERALATYDMHWAAKPPAEYELVGGSVWEIEWEKNIRNDPDFILYHMPIGLAVNSDELLEAVMFGDGKQPILLEKAGYLTQVEFHDVNPRDYRHTIVIQNAYAQQGRIVRETGKAFAQASYDPWGEYRAGSDR